jgi:hypothetical protein
MHDYAVPGEQAPLRLKAASSAMLSHVNAKTLHDERWASRALVISTLAHAPEAAGPAEEHSSTPCPTDSTFHSKPPLEQKCSGEGPPGLCTQIEGRSKTSARHTPGDFIPLIFGCTPCDG